MHRVYSSDGKVKAEVTDIALSLTLTGIWLSLTLFVASSLGIFFEILQFNFFI